MAKPIALQSKQTKRKKLKIPSPFCGKFLSKLSRHITSVHRDIEEVKKASKMPNKERQQACDKMKKHGIFTVERRVEYKSIMTLFFSNKDNAIKRMY